MSILDKIIFLLEEKGLQQKDLTDFLGLHKNAVTDWKNGKSKSYTKYLYRIADFFNVTPEYLVSEVLQKEKPTKEETTIILSNEEIQLINSYRSHPELQEAVNRILLPNKPSEVKLQISAKKEAPKLAAYGGDFKAPKEKKPKLT